MTDLFLIDKASQAASMFMLKQDPAFPRQTMVRLAFVDWPGHVCVPQLRQPCNSAVLPLWNLLGDKYTAEALMHCLQNNGIDDFMYKAGVFECQRHLNAAMSRIKFISLQDIPRGEETIMKQLRDARQALNRLYRCVEENKSHERAYERSHGAGMPKGSHSDRMHFHQLSKEIRDLEQTVLRDMKVLMMTSHEHARYLEQPGADGGDPSTVPQHDAAHLAHDDLRTALLRSRCLRDESATA